MLGVIFIAAGILMLVIATNRTAQRQAAIRRYNAADAEVRSLQRTLQGRGL